MRTEQSMATATPVLFSEKQCANGKILAFASLNSPKTLNALNLVMINLLSAKLKSWLDDEQVAAIIISGEGSKAFCAGGDVVSIYQQLASHKSACEDKDADPEQITGSLAYGFFSAEYQLDLLIHQATKPILALADGYAMGGGLGLMVGASHRIATENTVLAMPEVTIGLYPDVGASWFLNQMPKGLGLFLGLTGCFINGSDGRYLRLIDHTVNSQKIPVLLAQMQQVDWQDDELSNQAMLTKLLTGFSVEQSKQSGTIEQLTPLIQALTDGDNIIDIYNAIVNHSTDNHWFNQAQQKLSHGSPLSAHVIYQQLKRSKGCSLEQCFQQELALSLRHCQHSEFIEGVRALLVAKDNKPQWQYASIEQVEQAQVAWFFR